MTGASDVLVVGAGPTGLALALAAHDHGARVRVVERRPEAFRPSRALITHPRTLEVLRPYGVVDRLLERADSSPSARLHLGNRVVPVRMSEFALDDTPFPYLSLLRQMDLESVLGQALADRGVVVERGTELVGFRDTADGCRATLRSAAGPEQADCGFLAGCDGPASTVRSEAGIGWRGAAYRQQVVLADLELSGDLAPGVAHVVAGRQGLVFVFAVGERATWRLLATRAGDGSAPFGQPGPPVPADQLQRLLDEAGLPARITDVAWSARVRVQHRLATRFRAGSAFLAGDAAHAHSPAAAQGMNTGVQDAVNLGWKLAYAPASPTPDPLLDSYQAERRPVARLVLGLTHLVFWAESATDPVASFVRGSLVPLGAPVIPLLMNRRRLVAEGIRILSQLRLGYRTGPLSVAAPGHPRRGPRPGDRLPDLTVTVDGRPVRLHDLTAGPGIHVLADPAVPAPAFDAGGRVQVHQVDGVPGGGILAVRPDGYVGFRGGVGSTADLAGWLARVGASRPVSADAG